MDHAEKKEESFDSPYILSYSTVSKYSVTALVSTVTAGPCAF